MTNVATVPLSTAIMVDGQRHEITGLPMGAVLDTWSDAGIALLHDVVSRENAHDLTQTYALVTAHYPGTNPDGRTVAVQGLYLAATGGDSFATPVLEGQWENAITPLGAQGAYVVYAMAQPLGVTSIHVAAFVGGVLRPLGEVHRGRLPTLQPMTGLQHDGCNSAIVTGLDGSAVLTLFFNGDGTVQATSCICVAA